MTYQRQIEIAEAILDLALTGLSRGGTLEYDSHIKPVLAETYELGKNREVATMMMEALTGELILAGPHVRTSPAYQKFFVLRMAAAVTMVAEAYSLKERKMEVTT